MDLDWWYIGELVVNGANAGLMYSLVALGIVLIYKASGVANLAQGALVMTGGYVVLALAYDAGLPMWLVIPLSMVILFFFGMGIERIALRRMAGQPLIMIIMLTLGLEILLRGIVPAVWDRGGESPIIPLTLPADSIFIGDMLINTSYLLGGVIAIFLVILFVYFFRTRIGVVSRAVSDDPVAAWSVGISVERSIALSWGLAAVVSAIAGALWGSIQGVDWTLSLLLLKAVAVAILGGLDSIIGAILAGFMLGIAENLAAGFLDDIVGGGTKELVVASVILLTILIRPRGMFGREDIERI